MSGLSVFCEEREAEWAAAAATSLIGSSGFVLGDLNHNGVPEVVFGVSASFPSEGFYWQVLEHDGDSYRQIYVSADHDDEFFLCLLHESDGTPVIATITHQGGWMNLYDPATYVRRDRVQLTTHPLSYILAYDLDGDGSEELILSDSFDLHIYSGLAPYPLLKTYTDKGGYQLVAGQCDDDPAIELVIQVTGQSYVIDTATDQVQWDYKGYFGANLAVGDVDGDGREELIGDGPTIYDIETQTIIQWQSPEHVVSVVTVDLEDDGIDEIIGLNVNRNRIICHDGLTHQKLWEFPILNGQAYSMVVADLDLDQTKEIVLGCERSGFSVDQLYIMQLPDGQLEWQHQILEDRAISAAIGDLNGDQLPELVTGGAALNQIQIWDGATHTLVYSFNPLVNLKQGKRGLFYGGIRGLAIGDIDGDGAVEYAIASSYEVSGYLQVFDGQTHALKWQSPLTENVNYDHLILANIDADPQLELIVGETGYRAAPHLHVFDMVKGIEEWTSPALDQDYTPIVAILLEDLDGDGTAELVAALPTVVYIFDAVTHQLKGDVQISATALAAANLDDDPAMELLIGTQQGTVLIYDGTTFEPQDSRPLLNADPIRSLAVKDFDGDGILEWVAQGDAGQVVLNAEGQTVWSSTNCAGFMARGPVIMANLDQDPALELLAVSGFKVRYYEVSICGQAQFLHALPSWPDGSVLQLLSEVCP